ncbi:chaplin family protein [Nonomuraea sp. 3N208]|uniref:chaplin family protein n=1 Tax=Nonomuraea sp. 3N208 TaxID=3457421 RepID=UPI003FCD1D5B
MRTWAKASTPAALLAVAVMSFGGGTALADTSGDGSVGGGNQVDLPISLPIDISGNSVAAAGSAEASSQGGAAVVNDGKSGISSRTSGDDSVGGGNQVNLPISAPVNACGNAVSLFGKSDAGCKGGATVRKQGKGGAGGNRTSGDGSVLGGNQITAPISAPLNACGNAVAIFGDATAGCKGGANVSNTGAGGNRTSGDGSVLGGNQVVAPVSAPINICGNSVAVFGRAFSGCKGGSSVNNGGSGYRKHHMSAGNDTDGRFGAGSGNQVVAPISLPVEVCGNAVGNATGGCSGGAEVRNAGAGGNRTSGRGGVLSGNQAVAPIAAPVNVCGNSAALLGHAFAGCKGGAKVRNSGAGGNRTSGQGGVLSGNHAVAPIAAPINICGNAAAVLGASEAHCKGGAGVSPRSGGGNWTSGRGGVLAGNQIVAPIAAPVNVCGNAAAVLGDAAAGCLGGAQVGKPGYERSGGVYRFAHTSGVHAAGKAAAAESGLLPMLAAVPALGGIQGVPAIGALEGLPAAGALQESLGRLEGVSGVTEQVHGLVSGTRLQDVAGAAHLDAVSGLTQQVTAVPLVEDAARMFGLPALPELPGLPAQAQAPAKAAKAAHSGLADRGVPARSSSPLSPATDLIASTPVGGAVTSVTQGLPVGDIGLMSAEQPAGLTGMNASALLALALGAMFAASATLFASARRFRFARR